MKVLIINGSPRREGVIGTLLARAAAAAGNTIPEAGARAAASPDSADGTDSLYAGPNRCETVDACRLNFHPCTGCMQCRATGVCRLPHDDAHDVAEKIAAADLLVVGTPTYWGNMSGQLKLLLDRLVPVFMGESPRGIPQARQRGKRAVIVASCTTPWPFNRLMRQSRGAVAAVREVLCTGGYRVRSLQVAGTKKMNGLPERYPARLERMIKQMTK